MQESLAIYTQDVHKSYGRVKALRGVDLSVQTGEIFGFLGPNGAGKTTTIRCLLDLIRPDQGRLKVLGLDPQADPVRVRERVGYLPGELHIEDNLTVEGVLRFLNRLRGGKADWDFVLQLAERLDLDLGFAVKNLSKGNKQKVGLVQALMHRPECTDAGRANLRPGPAGPAGGAAHGKGSAPGRSDRLFLVAYPQ
jgi:ABC-2 type transport system ATP-binding protein